jgi:hypothetical protein
MHESPYTGLMPFTEQQAPFFFGRDVDCEIITANLMASRLTLLYGPSGVGKSSVLNAGVAHQLRQLARDAIARRGASEFAIVVFRSWRDDPLSGLGDAIAREVGSPARGTTFVERLTGWAEHLGGDLLIVLDQLEEYFLYHQGEDGDGTFATEFPRAVNRPDLRVSFLLSMREDSIAKLDFFKGRIPNLFDNYLRIDHLEREAARDAIVKPIDVFNRLNGGSGEPVTIEPELVEQVLDQVTAGRVTIAETGRGRLGARDGAVSHDRIETPYLQLVMTRLWNEETSANSKRLRAATLERLGGADQIVATHLDAALDALSVEDREAAAKIFQYLVTPSGTKIALGVKDLADYAHMEPATLRPLLVKLSSGENRILTPVAPAPDQPAGEWYQIFHDVLAAAVLEWRTRYVKVAEQKAAEAVAQEERRRAEKEARAAARLRKLLALVAVLFVLAAAAAVVAWRQTQTARAQSRLAEQQRLRADLKEAEADSANHAAQARLVETNAANARNIALEAEKEGLKLTAQAAEARVAGQLEQSARLKQQAVVATSRAASAQQDVTRYTLEAKKEQAAADAALTRASQLAIRLPPGNSPEQKAPAAAVETQTPASSLPPPPTGAPVSAPPANNPPANTPTTSGPAAIPKADPKAEPKAEPKADPLVANADYRESYRKGIEAKNRKRWSEAVRLFQDALAVRGIDTGERINISGFGNIEPYVPHYYLGLSLKNLDNCKEALQAFELSEKDGAIQKTNLFKSLQQSRQECMQPR